MERKFILKERFNRIGFDRCKLTKIGVLDYDLRHLQNIKQTDSSLKKLSFKGNQLNTLQIDRKELGRLYIKRIYPKDFKDYLFTYLDFSPTNVIGQNIENLDIKELKYWIIKIFDEIEKLYRI